MSTGRTQTPTLINLPPPPSDPATPSDAPGTPNSATTTMSELSTVAIKDGHRGHLSHSHHNPMDAERADRISRLAGLDRVGGHTPRISTPGSNTGSANPSGGHYPVPTAYFDANNNPQISRERSTVGSASATGSVGGRTTWASGSDVYDPDKMSEDTNMLDGEVDNSSMGGFSDDGAGTSLSKQSDRGETPVDDRGRYQNTSASASAAATAARRFETSERD